jgi:hypothetical protein
LKLEHDQPFSIFAFKFNLRRYIVVICVALASAAAQMAVIYSEGGAPLPLNLAGLASLLCLQCHSSHVTQSQIKFSWIKRHRVTWRALSVQSPTLVSD